MATADLLPPGAARPPAGLPLEPEMHSLVQKEHTLTSVGEALGSEVCARLV